MVDIAAIVIDVANNVANVETYAELPDTRPDPVAVVAEAGGAPRVSTAPQRLRTQDVQIDVWAGTKAAAHDATESITAALLAIPRSHNPRPGGTVQYVRVGAARYQPDTDWPNDAGRPRPRYIIVATVTAHE